jgi:hypothetical protein
MRNATVKAEELANISSYQALLEDKNWKSLTAIDGHDRQYFNELRARVVSP